MYPIGSINTNYAEWLHCINGKGTYIYPDGSKYVGQFKNERMDGHGTLTSQDGAKYVGEFQDNKLNGHGILVRPNGIKYVGKFKNNKIHGQGVMTSPDGKKMSGEFRNGEFVFSRRLRRFSILLDSCALRLISLTPPYFSTISTRLSITGFCSETRNLFISSSVWLEMVNLFLMSFILSYSSVNSFTGFPGKDDEHCPCAPKSLSEWVDPPSPS